MRGQTAQAPPSMWRLSSTMAILHSKQLFVRCYSYLSSSRNLIWANSFDIKYPSFDHFQCANNSFSLELSQSSVESEKIRRIWIRAQFLHSPEFIRKNRENERRRSLLESMRQVEQCSNEQLAWPEARHSIDVTRGIGWLKRLNFRQFSGYKFYQSWCF